MDTPIGILDYISNPAVTKNIRSTSSLVAKKYKKHQKRSNPNTKKNKDNKITGQVFMIVKYDGDKYSAYSIVNDTATRGSSTTDIREYADEIAEQLNIENNHKQHGYMAVPIHIPGTIPVMYLNIEVQTYYKNTPYYATMRSTYGDSECRAIALWKTEIEAVRFANLSESMKNPKFIYTYIGGPIKLC